MVWMEYDLVPLPSSAPEHGDHGAGLALSKFSDPWNLAQELISSLGPLLLSEWPSEFSSPHIVCNALFCV